MAVYDEMLDGAVDLHCHVDLEFSESIFRKREPEWEWLPKAEKAGIAGYVLKSHMWPTMAMLPLLRELYHGPVQVYGSVTLNSVCGGIDLWSVEVAAAMGARAVFMPTWGSANDRIRGGFNRRLEGAFTHFDPGRLSNATAMDDQGRLREEIKELLRLCKEKQLILATGHLAWEEALAIAEEASDIGFKKLVFSHPLSNSVGAPVEAMRRAAELGAWIEICWTNVSPGRLAPSAVVDIIRSVGVEQVVVSTDYFLGNNPSPPELFRLLLGVLFEAGMTFNEGRAVAAVNTQRVMSV